MTGNRGNLVPAMTVHSGRRGLTGLAPSGMTQLPMWAGMKASPPSNTPWSCISAVIVGRHVIPPGCDHVIPPAGRGFFLLGVRGGLGDDAPGSFVWSVAGSVHVDVVAGVDEPVEE